MYHASFQRVEDTLVGPSSRYPCGQHCARIFSEQDRVDTPSPHDPGTSLDQTSVSSYRSNPAKYCLRVHDWECAGLLSLVSFDAARPRSHDCWNLAQALVLCSCFLQDRNLRVSLSPEVEEILICGFGLHWVAGDRECSAEL